MRTATATYDQTLDDVREDSVPRAAQVPDECELSPGHQWIVGEDASGKRIAHSSEDGFSRLRREIIEGHLGRDVMVKVLPPVTDADDKARDSVEATSLHLAARQIHGLDLLYRPIWACALRGALIGGLAGIALKFLDTSASMFAAAPTLGGIWILLAVCLVASGKVPQLTWAPVIVWFLALRAGVNISLIFFFGAMLTTVLVGLAFGIPLGMAIGTLVGFIRSGFSAQAPDAEPAPLRSFVLGLAAPLAATAAMVWFYVYHIMPWAISMVGSGT